MPIRLTNVYSLRRIGAIRPADVRMPEFQWVNTILDNLKTSLSGAYHAFDFTLYTQRYLGAIMYHFNRRFDLRALPNQLLVAAATIGPRLKAWIRMAETHC